MNTATGDEVSVVEVDNINVKDDIISFTFGGVLLKVLLRDIKYIKFIDSINKNNLYPNSTQSNIKEPDYQDI